MQELISSDQLISSWGGEDQWQFTSDIFFDKPAQSDESQGFKVTPSKILMFSPSSNNRHDSSINITNTGEMFLAVKLRTTNPALFNVSPHTACLAPGQQINIRSVRFCFLFSLSNSSSSPSP